MRQAKRGIPPESLSCDCASHNPGKRPACQANPLERDHGYREFASTKALKSTRDTQLPPRTNFRLHATRSSYSASRAPEIAHTSQGALNKTGPRTPANIQQDRLNNNSHAGCTRILPTNDQGGNDLYQHNFEVHETLPHDPEQLLLDQETRLRITLLFRVFHIEAVDQCHAPEVLSLSSQ